MISNRTTVVRLVIGGTLVATALAVASAGAASAVADYYPYKKAEVTFATTESSITATIFNPNEQGICFATIGILGQVMIFGGDHDADWPEAGETFTLTQSGLEPGEYRVATFCQLTETNWGSYSMRDDTVRIGPERSAGSLAFGSLGG